MINIFFNLIGEIRFNFDNKFHTNVIEAFFISRINFYKRYLNLKGEKMKVINVFSSSILCPQVGFLKTNKNIMKDLTFF